MPRAPRKFPAKPARDIFTVAEDFHAAQMALAVAAIDNWRIIGPQAAMTAFTVELYLKCIQVIAGAAELEGIHNLHQVFLAIEQSHQDEIRRHWRGFHASFVANEGSAKFSADIGDVLSKSGNSFEDWRYYHEYDATRLHLDATLLDVVDILRLYVLSIHPDWDDAGAYFQSIFPAPKIPISNATFSPAVSGNRKPALLYLLPSQGKEPGSRLYLSGHHRISSTL